MVPNETLLEILAFLKLFELDGVLMASGSVSKAALECAGQLSRSDCQTVVLLTDGAVVHLDRTGATIKRVYVPNGIYVEQLKLLIQNSVIADNCVAVDCDCGRAGTNYGCHAVPFSVPVLQGVTARPTASRRRENDAVFTAVFLTFFGRISSIFGFFG